jgi:TRAP-type C4-dicarboxylate transport system permease small subunit
MKYIEQAIDGICKALLWGSTVVIFLILVVNTILRYATGSSLQWANEVPELLFPWLVMSGVVLAAQRGAHITTAFLMEKLNERTRKWVGVIGWLIVAALYSVLVFATFQMLDIVHDEKSPILQIPGSLTYGCVMGGMIMLAFLAMTSAFQVWSMSGQLNTDVSELKVHW